VKTQRWISFACCIWTPEEDIAEGKKQWPTQLHAGCLIAIVQGARSTIAYLGFWTRFAIFDILLFEITRRHRGKDILLLHWQNTLHIYYAIGTERT
jgi:hypothetical protein